MNQTAASGDYCVDGEAVELPSSIGLEVKGFGEVKLPLEDPQASELIEKVCKLAPFGKDELTLYDKNVRDSYQIDPAQVTISKRQWNNKLDHLVKRVGLALGCHDEIQVDSI